MSIYRQQVHSSKIRGHQPPTYTIDEIVNKYINNKKYIKLHKAWVASNYDRWLAPSLDRINNDLGYSFDNIELMTWEQNHANGDRDQKLGKLVCGNTHVGVSQYTKEGVFIQSFISQHEASRATGVSNKRISDCLNGRLKSTGGFLWKRDKHS